MTPILIRTSEPLVGPVASSTSVRLIVSCTGWPLFRDSTAASGSRYIFSLPPKPPPISIGTTLISDTGRPSTFAALSRMPKWPWLLHQIVSRPSGDHDAVPFWGST